MMVKVMLSFFFLTATYSSTQILRKPSVLCTKNETKSRDSRKIIDSMAKTAFAQKTSLWKIQSRQAFWKFKQMVFV